MSWIFYVYSATSAGVLVAALASVATAFMRRWPLTQRLGRASLLGALGVFAAGLSLSMSIEFLVDDGPPLASKATHLANAISNFMNVTAMTVPAFVIGAVTWFVARAVQRRDADAFRHP